MKRAARSDVVRQSAGYIVSVLASNAMALVTTVLLTRILSLQGYSEYALSLSLLIFMALFFELGMFYPTAQLIARATGQGARAITGASIILWLCASAIFTITVVTLTVGPLQSVFKVNVAIDLRTVSPLAGAWLATQVALLVAQGHGRLHVYSATDVLRSALFLGLTFLALVSGTNDPRFILLMYGITSLLGSIVCLAWFKPIFRGWTRAAGAILTQTRAWGLNVFVGRVLSTGTYRLDVLMLAALSGGADVANYVLAAAITAPIGLPGLASATALFKQMTATTHIDRKWILPPLSASLAGTLMLALGGSQVVDLLFSSTYAAASTLLIPLSLAATLQGATAAYNRFIAAHEGGKVLRTTALWLSGANVVFNFALIPPFAAMGAAWASVLALTVNLVAHIIPYRRLVYRLRNAPSGYRVAQSDATSSISHETSG